MEPDETNGEINQPADTKSLTDNPNPKLVPESSPPRSNLATVIMIAIATLLAIAGVAIFAIFEITGPTQPISM